MQTHRPAGAIILVSTRGPEATVAEDFKALGMMLCWAPSIEAVRNFSSLDAKETVIVTELALRDGNWRDLVERVRRDWILSRIMLLTSDSTAELWWDALECGIDEILPAPLKAFRLYGLLDA